MRLLEIVFLASLVLTGLALFFPPPRRASLLRYWAAVPVALALVHLLIDHGRWQLFAAYALAGLIAIAAIVAANMAAGASASASASAAASGTANAARRDGQIVARGRRLVRWLGGLVILAVSGLSIAAASLVPFFELPAPTGSYKIGNRWLYLVDSSRTETLAPSPGGPRALVVRVWYPADSVAGSADRYISRQVAQAIAHSIKLPTFAFTHLTNVTTHAYPLAWIPSTPQRLPLLLFSHGYAAGTESQNTVQMEELASHGFVVASIDHPYEAGGVIVPPDSTLIPANPPFQPFDTTEMKAMMATMDRIKGARDTAQVVGPIREILAQGAVLDTAADRWLADTRFVLDRLTTMSSPHAGSDTLLVGRLATDAVGIFGMSFGGATAANFCTVDPRCVAGMNLDGLHYGVASRSPLPRPFFIASSQGNPNVHRLFYERAQAPAWLMVTSGAEHMDYTDFGWFAPWLGAKGGMLGGIAAPRMHALMNAIVVPWFDAALRGGPPLDARALAARFPEITIEYRDGTPPVAPAAAMAAPAALRPARR
ncbi:MAG: hypothetical protein IT359_11960 [Gemmatimonadaceae bacterium]|nr:hypothetical protein [Gemmatimonadaceae bacterium]